MWSFAKLADQIHEGLQASLPPGWALAAEMTIVGLSAIGLFALLGLVLVLMERKVSAFMQILSLIHI